MTVSTVSVAAGARPSARVLILKDVDGSGWHFAVSSASRKGAELSRNPAVALTFYWPALVAGTAVALRRSPQPNRDGRSSTSPSRRRYSHGTTGIAAAMRPARP